MINYYYLNSRYIKVFSSFLRTTNGHFIKKNTKKRTRKRKRNGIRTVRDATELKPQTVTGKKGNMKIEKKEDATK